MLEIASDLTLITKVIPEYVASGYSCFLFRSLCILVSYLHRKRMKLTVPLSFNWK